MYVKKIWQGYKAAIKLFIFLSSRVLEQTGEDFVDTDVQGLRDPEEEARYI
jgi:hypothetical protein